MEKQITLEQILGAQADALRNSLYHRMPGAVLSYDAGSQTAKVQPMVNDVRVDVDSGAIVFEPWQPIENVPVAWPQFGSFVIAGFLEANDQVTLEAFDLDISAWRAQGRSTQPVNPADPLRHGGGYWSATPTDLTGPIASAPSAPGIVIGKDGAPAQQIVIDASGVKVGAGAGAIVSTTTGVAIGSAPAALAAGEPTFSALTLLAGGFASLAAMLTANPSAYPAFALALGPLLATLATQIATPLPLVQTTTVTAGP